MATIDAYAANAASAGDVRQHASWSPYDNNGGTTIAVAGQDYCVVAASTRLSTGYSVLTRTHSMLTHLSPFCVLASAGFDGDRATLTKKLKTRAVMYKHNHRKPISCEAMAQNLANTLYHKRFFPFYTFNLIAGLDAKGVGAVYSYDAVGSYERCGFSCSGSGIASSVPPDAGSQLMQPLLDHQLQAASPLVLPPRQSVTMIPMEKAVDIIKDAFTGAGERDIYTGDTVEIWVMTKDGVTKETFELKKD